MAETYFDYILSQCKTQCISSICEVVSTRKALMEKANSEFNGCNNITADWRLLETVKNCLNNHGILAPNSLGRDAMDVYNRCRLAAFSYGNNNYDQLFDLLVDFIWLQASIQNEKNKPTRYTNLLSDPIRIRCGLKEYLLDVYNGAIQNSNECAYIDEAVQAKRQFFTGLFPFQYEKSRYYISSDFMTSDLMSMQKDIRDNSLKGMALFFGLTATAALAEDICRGIC